MMHLTLDATPACAFRTAVSESGAIVCGVSVNASAGCPDLDLRLGPFFPLHHPKICHPVYDDVGRVAHPLISWVRVLYLLSEFPTPTGS